MKRICKKCGEEKEIEEFRKDITCLYGYRYSCKKCTNDRNRVVFDKNYYKKYNQKPERRAWIKKYIQNPERITHVKKYNQKPETITRVKKYNRKPEIKAGNRKRNRKERAQLSDRYIKVAISAQYKDIKYSYVTPKMVELKRAQLKFHREIQKGKGVLNEIHSNV